jgi:lipopolysaccharide/colanic/teichoic acid biosynthesis glycosyltransferase
MILQVYSDQSEFLRNLQSFDFDLFYAKGRKLAKLVFDFIMELAGLIIPTSVFVYVGILIKHTFPGPVFFNGIQTNIHYSPIHTCTF